MELRTSVQVLLKSAIPDTGVRCPKYVKEEDEVFPCMVKVDQSMGGDSNYVAYNKKHLADTLKKFTEDFGEGVPIVITEFVENVEKTLGCQFYLNRKGEVHWLGASLNVLNGYAWDGCEVDWDLNEYYRRRVYDSFILPVAKYLHKKRYFGIAGIDIITSPSGDYLVDINARITGCAPHVLIAPEMAREGLTKSLFKKRASHKCSTEKLIKEANYINETTDRKILILNSMDVDEGCIAAIVAFGQTMTEVEDLFDCLTVEKLVNESGYYPRRTTTAVSKYTTEDRKRDAERGDFSVLLKLDQSFLSEKDGNASEIFSYLKTRHTVVLETSCSSEIPLERRRGIVHDYCSKICKEKKHTKIITREKQEVITYETVSDLQYTFEELGIDIGNVNSSYVKELNLYAKEISEANAVTAYLRQAARKILNRNSHRIHSIIPCHYNEQTAVVIYTYDPTQDLFKNDWSEEFLGFSVFVINLMFGYATEPPVFPKPYPTIPSEEQDNLNEIKDEITQKLSKKHSNLSTVAVDYRIKGNKLQDEICLQIGVLTKGIFPLGEEEIRPSEIDSKVSLDVVESSATLCFGKLGVGIGVQGDNTSTGSLGAIVKHNNTGELYLLSNAHVLLRNGASSSIVHPSQEDYEEDIEKKKKSHEIHKKRCQEQRSMISEREFVGASTGRQKEALIQMERDLNRAEEDCKEIAPPHIIATFKYHVDHFKKQRDYLCKSHSKKYGIDAAIALIDRDEFNPKYVTEVHEWPSDLKENGPNNVEKIALNGSFKNKEVGEHLLKFSDVVVYKCGRTTGVTRGTLLKEMNVRMNSNDSAIFVPMSHESEDGAASQPEVSRLQGPKPELNKMWHNVLYIKSSTVKCKERRDFCAGGDSGAVVFDEEGSCVGLLFGRMDTALFPVGGGLATPIHIVFDALNISLASADDFKAMTASGGLKLKE